MVHIERPVVIHVNGFAWKPRVHQIDRRDCVEIAAGDRAFATIVADMCGVSLERARGLNPSLHAVRGFQRLRDRRNLAQADQLIPVVPEPKSKLFAESSLTPKKRKRTRDELRLERSARSLFTIEIDSHMVTLARPVLPNDAIIIELTEANLRSVVLIIQHYGASDRDFWSKRVYRAGEDEPLVSGLPSEIGTVGERNEIAMLDDWIAPDELSDAEKVESGPDAIDGAIAVVALDGAMVPSD